MLWLFTNEQEELVCFHAPDGGISRGKFKNFRDARDHAGRPRFARVHPFDAGVARLMFLAAGKRPHFRYR